MDDVDLSFDERSVSDINENRMEDSSGNSNQPTDQIVELQDAVREMKTAFTLALQELGAVEKDDKGTKVLIDKYRVESQEQIAEIVKLILSMKAEFSIVKSQVQLAQEFQYSLQQQVHTLLYERDVLLEELENSGVISEHARKRLQHCRSIHHPSSGSHSNDSGVAFLLEKAQAVFHQNRNSILSPQSDQDSNSLPENATMRVSTLVQEYLAGLEHKNQDESNGQSSNQDYDSDCSLTIAANKSLTLSTSLGKQCSLEFDHQLKDAAQIGPMDTTDDIIASSTPSKSHVQISRSMSQERQTKERTRLKVIKELVDSERTYCRTLWTLLDGFVEPLKKSAILANRDINSIFPEENQQLYDRHCALLQKFEDRLAVWKWSGAFADILEAFTDPKQSNVLGLYTSYMNDFPEVIKAFHKSCQQSALFTKFLKECLDHPNCAHNDLGSILLAPVQRIPAYILALKQLLKCTDDEHADEKNIRVCLQRLKEFLSRLNDAMEHSFQLIAARISSNSDFLCDDKFIDDEFNDAESVNNAETILLDECSDAASLCDKIKHYQSEFQTTQPLEERNSYEENKYQCPEQSSPVKTKQVPKKPPRTPRKVNRQSDHYYSKTFCDHGHHEGRPSSSEQTLHGNKCMKTSASDSMCQACYCPPEQTCRNCNIAYDTCHMTPTRKLACNSHEVSRSKQREMGRSLNCIHEAPVSISNSQSSLTKSQSVNRVSEWKKGSETPLVENHVKKMSKMKSLRASLKNLFKKR